MRNDLGRWLEVDHWKEASVVSWKSIQGLRSYKYRKRLPLLIERVFALCLS
jgi:hypothetical protein